MKRTEQMKQCAQPLTRGWVMALSVALALGVGCDREKATTSPDAPGVVTGGAAKSGQLPLQNSTLVVSEVRVTHSPQMTRQPWTPRDEVVTTHIEAKLAKSAQIKRETGALVTLTVHFGAVMIPTADPPQRMALGASVTLEAAHGGMTLERVRVPDEVPETPEARVAMLLEQVDEAWRGLEDLVTTQQTRDEALAAHVKGSPELGREAAVEAAGRLRELAQRDTTQRDTALVALRQLARREEPQVVTATVGALVLLGDEGIGALLVDAASRMSKVGSIPAYVALLAQMAEVKEPVVRAYLDAVSSGHPDEMVRQIASDSLAAHGPAAGAP